MSRAPYEYPPWVPGRPQPSQPSRPSVNSTTAGIRDVNITAAAINSPIPIAYGRCELAPLIFATGKIGNDLVLGCAWCVGEIQAIEQIYDGDAPMNAGWIAQNYTGNPAQLPDTTLAAAIPGYADSLVMTVRGETVSVAYSVLRIPSGQNFPSGMKAVVHGRKSWTAEQNNVEVEVARYGNAYYKQALQGYVQQAPGLINGDVGTAYASTNQDADQYWVDFGRTVSISRVRANLFSESPGYAPGTRIFSYRTAAGAWVEFHRETISAGSNTSFDVDFNVDPPIDADSIAYLGTGFSSGYPYPKYSICNEIKVYEIQQTVYLYSANPALCLSDLCASKALGLGVRVEPDSLQEAIDYCDEQVNGKPRHTLNLAIIRQAPIEDHIETLRAYANCWVVKDGDRIALVPNRPKAPSAKIDERDMVEDSVSIEQISVQDTPTIVSVEGTDSSSWTWTNPSEVVYHPDVYTTDLEARISSVRLPGIHDNEEAKRMATLRLNYFNLIDLRFSCAVFDEGLDLMIGDVVLVNHSWGLQDKPMRIIGQNAIDTGRYRLEMEEYDPKVYSEDVETVPSYPDTLLRQPSDVPIVKNLRAKSASSSSLSVSWLDVGDDYPYPLRYRAEIEDRSGSVVDRRVTDITTAVVNVPSSGGPFIVRVRAEAIWGGTEHLGPWSWGTWDGTSWLLGPTPIAPPAQQYPSGGSEHDFTIGPNTYRVHKFTSSGVLDVPTARTMQFFVLGGGGAGGGGPEVAGGGGGAGALVKGSVGFAKGQYVVTVGGAGADSSIDGIANAEHGGAGGRLHGATGGCGGGGSGHINIQTTGGSGSIGGDGGIGYLDPSFTSLGGGGGGGMGGDGGAGAYQIGGNGGAAVSDDFDGTARLYAGGGGGCNNGTNNIDNGSIVGGMGALWNSSSAKNASVNTGSGGGGGGYRTGGTIANVGLGSSGLVMVRYIVV